MFSGEPVFRPLLVRLPEVELPLLLERVSLDRCAEPDHHRIGVRGDLQGGLVRRRCALPRGSVRFHQVFPGPLNAHRRRLIAGGVRPRPGLRCRAPCFGVRVHVHVDVGKVRAVPGLRLAVRAGTVPPLFEHPRHRRVSDGALPGRGRLRGQVSDGRGHYGTGPPQRVRHVACAVGLLRLFLRMHGGTFPRASVSSVRDLDSAPTGSSSPTASNGEPLTMRQLATAVGAGVPQAGAAGAGGRVRAVSGGGHRGMRGRPGGPADPLTLPISIRFGQFCPVHFPGSRRWPWRSARPSSRG